MHESESEATTLEIPATKRRVTLKAGDTFSVNSGSVFKLLEVLKGHGQRVVVEITTPGVTMARGLVEVSSGKFCRLIDHRNGCCDCGEYVFPK